MHKTKKESDKLKVTMNKNKKFPLTKQIKII